MTSRLLLIGTLSLPLCSMVLGTASTAAAHPLPPSASVADEEMYIERGVSLRKKGDDEAALHEFRHAYEVSKSGRALAQVALAEQALGQWVDAEAHLVAALSHEKEPWIGRNKAPLVQSLSDIKDHLGSLELSGGVAGSQVKINGQVVGTLPLSAPLRVASGSVAIEVSAAGYLTVVRVVNVLSKGLSREPVVMVPRPEAEQTTVEHQAGRTTSSSGGAVKETEPPRPDSGGGGWSGMRTTGVVVVAVGVVALGAGAGFLLQRENRAVDFNRSCGFSDNRVSGPAECTSKYNAVQSSYRLAVGGFVAAGVLLAGGATLFIVGGNEGGTRSAESPHAASRWACAPSLGLGASCAVTF